MKFFSREKGQGLVEYALLIVLIAMVVLGILTLLGPQISSAYSRVISALGGGVITGVSASAPTEGAAGYDFSVSVQVTEPTTLTFEGGGVTVNKSCAAAGSCTINVHNAGTEHGSYTIKADGGSKGTYSGTY